MFGNYTQRKDFRLKKSSLKLFLEKKYIEKTLFKNVVGK
jgi:hypothetical protein